MSDWEKIYLGEFCSIKTGKKDVNEGNPDGYFPFFTCSRKHTWSDKYSFDTEAILVAGNGEVGNLHYYNGKFEAYQRTYVLSNFKINILYSYHYLSAFLLRALEKEKVGTSIPYIKLNNLKRFEIVIPKSEPEQTKIAEILSCIDTAIEQTEAMIAKQQRIKTGLMQDLLSKGIDEHGNIRTEQTHSFKDSELGRIPVEWDCVTLGEIITKFGGKIQTGPFGSQLHSYEYVPEGVPVIMPQDITNTDISTLDIAQILEKKANELARHRVKIGDLIFARRGDLSRCAFIEKREEGWLCGTGCLLLRPPKKMLSSRWMAEIYKYHSSQSQIDIKAVGSTMPNLNTGILFSLIVPFPSFEEQKEIENRMIVFENEQIA